MGKGRFSHLSSSHESGVWLLIILSFRKLLLVRTRNQLVTDGVLGLCLIEFESTLHSRPFVSLFSDAKGQPPLTPNSLPLSRDGNGIPGCGGVEGNYSHSWRQVNYLTNTWWRWLKENPAIP